MEKGFDWFIPVGIYRIFLQEVLYFGQYRSISGEFCLVIYFEKSHSKETDIDSWYQDCPLRFDLSPHYPLKLPINIFSYKKVE